MTQYIGDQPARQCSLLRLETVEPGDTIYLMMRHLGEAASAEIKLSLITAYDARSHEPHVVISNRDFASPYEDEAAEAVGWDQRCVVLGSLAMERGPGLAAKWIFRKRRGVLVPDAKLWLHNADNRVRSLLERRVIASVWRQDAPRHSED